MDRLVIKPTESTLGVEFDPESATLAFRGESYPENALKFFSPILQWLGSFFAEKQPGDEVVVDMDIVYFNSSSSKVLMNLFDNFESAARRGIKVSIRWRFDAENEIAEECGEEFGEELQAADFQMLPYGGDA